MLAERPGHFLSQEAKLRGDGNRPEALLKSGLGMSFGGIDDGFVVKWRLEFLVGAGVNEQLRDRLEELRNMVGNRLLRILRVERLPGGLWTTRFELLRDDPARAPGPAVASTVVALAEAIKALHEHDHEPFAAPYRLDDAGWVANRWCELLPLPLAARQKLMALDDPVIRLSLVDGYLRDKKVIIG